MSRSRKTLIVSGMALAVWGTCYGLYYALFVEHQRLDRIGASMAAGFVNSAERNAAGAASALDSYSRESFVYVREVDVHSHWTGLAMLLIVLGLAFDRVGWRERRRFQLAVCLVAGSGAFPLGVILQTASPGFIPKAIAAAGAGLVIIALALAAAGFARPGTPERQN